MKKIKTVRRLAVIVAALSILTACGNASGSENSIKLLNASYDPTRELYEEFNEQFAEYWEQEKGQEVVIYQSHGGSGSQARSVIDGLDADVVTLALAYDIDAIEEKNLIEEGWMNRLDHNSAPYTSTILFLVRKGNPKGIKDWDDLNKGDISVITPNPKTSGGARWNYLAAYGYALGKYNNDEAKAQQFVGDLYKRVEVLDSGARASTTTFVEKNIGDVLITWENEAFLALDELGHDKFEIVAPSVSILAEPSVAVVDRIVDKKGTREIAEAYIDYLYTDAGQEIATKNYYRPRSETIAAKYKDQFPEIELFTIDEKFGSWKEAHEKHFADGGVFDAIYE